MLGKFGENTANAALVSRFGRAVTGRLSLNRAVIFMLHRSDRPEHHQTGHRAEMLQATFDCLYDHGLPIVPLSTLVEHYIQNEPFDHFSVAFTVDDGFEDQGSNLLPIFLENQVPVTTFLITNLADGNFWPWDYKVKFALLNTKKKRLVFDLGCGPQLFYTSTLANQRLTYRAIIERVKSFSTSNLTYFLQDLERKTDVEIPVSPPESHRPLTWEEARKLEQRGVQFGPHSENHRSIVHLTNDEADAEIAGSWESMRRNLANPVPIFCWPIGRHEDMSRETMQIAKEKELVAGLSAESGYINMHKAPTTLHEQFAMPRFPLPTDIVEFHRIISGMSGIKLNRKTVFNLPKRSGKRSLLGSVVPISRYQLKNDLFTLAFHGGAFSRWTKIDWSEVNRLVFVCKGNICRSPYAEYRAKSFGIDSISYGTEAGNGASAPETAQICASFRGIDLSVHQSKLFDISELRSGDLVLGMEPDHIDILNITATKPGAQLSLLGLWQRTPSVFIPDPFDKPFTEFSKVFSSIDRSLKAVARNLIDSQPPDHLN